MLTSKWFPDHTNDTIVLGVELPELQQLIDDRLLLRQTGELRYITGVVYHGTVVVICAQGKADAEEDIHEWINPESACACQHVHGRLRKSTYPGEW